MGKMKMLFLDDRTKRIHAALRKYGGKFDVTICANVVETLRYLSAQEWDVISLDYDLNGHDFQEPEDPTCGMEIARYIQRCGWPPRLKRPIVILHSSNAFGRGLMAERLRMINFTVHEEKFEYDHT